MDESNHQQLLDPTIFRLTRFKARQLAGRFGFAYHDVEDIQQDLLLDFLCRSRRFDSHRCSRRTFARFVVNNRVAALVQARKAACRDHRVDRLSLDHPIGQQDGSGFPSFSGADIANQRRWMSLESQLNLRLDVAGVLIRLPAALVDVCRLLMVSDSATDAAAKAGISRATFYRRIAKVRTAFAEAGLGGRIGAAG